MTITVVVMGVSGSGKSTVGRALAQRLGVPFEDADRLHPPANVAKMTAGEPLTDDDRRPWLAKVGDWLAAHPDSVVSCSALKRAYRDQLRVQRPTLLFLHLSAPAALIAERLAARPGHFMPATLLESQFDTLEPLGADERGVTVDISGCDAEAVVDCFLTNVSGACGDS